MQEERKSKKEERYANNSRIWTEEELNYLAESWGIITLNSMAERLQRTEEAVRHRGGKEGLGSMYTSQQLSANQIAEIMGVEPRTVSQTWKNNHGLKIKKKKMAEREMFLIRADKFMDWAKKNQDIWDSRKVKKYALGHEPEWLTEKRKEDYYKPKNQGKLWSRADESKLKQQYKKKDLEQLGREFGRTPEAIQTKISKLKKAGELEKRPTIPWTEEEDEILKKMDSNAEPDADIAWALARTVSHIQYRRAHLRKKGLYPKISKQKRRQKIREKKYRKLKVAGKTPKEMAEKIGVSVNTIYRYAASERRKKKQEKGAGKNEKR